MYRIYSYRDICEAIIASVSTKVVLLSHTIVKNISEAVYGMVVAGISSSL